MTAIGGRRSDLEEALSKLRETINSPSFDNDEPPAFLTRVLKEDDWGWRSPLERRGLSGIASRVMSMPGMLVGTALGLVVVAVSFGALNSSVPSRDKPLHPLQVAGRSEQAELEGPRAQPAAIADWQPKTADFEPESTLARAKDVLPLLNVPQLEDKPPPWPAPPSAIPTGKPAGWNVDHQPEAQASAVAPKRKLDPRQANALLDRAEAMLKNGDLTAARLILERVAEGEDARAAYLLARTYDPAVMQKLGIIGISPDAEKARRLYEQARMWGSSEAGQRYQAFAPASAATVGAH